MAMKSCFRPVDILSLGFAALLAFLTVFYAQLIPHWHWLLIRYLLLALAIASAAMYVKNMNTRRPVVFLYTFLPVLIVPVIFDSLGDLIPWIRPGAADDILIRIDYAIFGVHPTVWLERLVDPVLTFIMQTAYIMYYPMAIALGAVLAAKRKEKELDEAIFGIVLCFYLSYLGYILVPAVGPRFALADMQAKGLDAWPIVTAIQNTLNALENTKTDAFPSGHTAIALMTLYYAWRSKEKLLSFILLPVVCGLIFSTVYLRYHYVIDVISGILLAAATITIAPSVKRMLSRSTNPAR